MSFTRGALEHNSFSDLADTTKPNLFFVQFYEFRNITCVCISSKNLVLVYHTYAVSVRKGLYVSPYWSSFAAGFVDGVKVKKLMIAKVRMHAKFM